jgi:capsular polysaccharide biosynthesis protein
LRDFQRESLQMLGLSDDQLVIFAGDVVWDCERLWFASMPPSGAEVPDAVNWLRDRFFSATGQRPNPQRRLYISRELASNARVVNNDEVTSLLEDRGFEVVCTELLSVEEQVRLFATAECVVAPHGAGLTNILFASPQCKLLEFIEPEWASTMHTYLYWTMAETLGQPYSYFLAETVQNPNDPRRADLHVSLARLRRGIDRFLDL